ncbi:MAG: outer membrane protein transport protein [Myxococcales bacterium]|nr:outer membrane protein transport protein [Myxococcales bacterium]
MRALATLAGIATAVCTLAISTTALAGPAETYGFLSRSTAMGGAVSADATDVSANFYNPAGLASAPGVRIDIGYMRANASLRMNGKDNGVDAVHGLVFGLVAPGKLLGMPFAFGVALHLPDDRVFRVRALDQQQPRWEIYDNRPQRLFFGAHLAIQPVKWLEIGGGLVFLAATRARLDITGDLSLSDAATSRLRHEVDADLTSIRYPQLGLRLKPTDRLRLSAVYRGEFQLTLDIEARLAVQAKLRDSSCATTLCVPFFTYLTTSSVNAFLPRQVVLGGSYDVTPDVTLDADVTWIQWSSYKSPMSAVTAQTKFDPPPGFPASLTPEKPAPTVVLPPNFQNRVVPRIGVEARLPLSPKGHSLALRGGYFYERSPVPPQSGGTNFVDADRHAFSVGTGLKLHAPFTEMPGDIHFDLHAQWSYLPERVFTKDSPADPIGDYRASGQIWSFGTTLGLAF